MSARILCRSLWSADPTPPPPTPTLVHPVTHVVFGFATETAPCRDLDACRLAMRALQRRHRTRRKLADVAYNFVVGGDGWVYEGRGWHRQPHLGTRLALVAGSSLLVGYFGDLKENKFSEKIWQLGYELIEFGYSQKYISPNCKIVEEDNDMTP